jgi:hypothetical protein
VRGKRGVSVGRRTLLGLVSLAALAVTAPVAAAAPQVPGRYTEGAVDGAWGYNCLSISLPPLLYEEQVLAGAAVQSSRRHRVRPGRVFYARAVVGIIGNTCSGAGVRIHVIPPRGVRTAVSRRHPIWWDYTGTPQPPAPSTGHDDVRASSSPFGGLAMVAFYNGRVQPWPLANGVAPLAIHVPLVSSRPLNGRGPRRCWVKGSGRPPCSPRRARDYLQVAVEVGAAVYPTLLVAEAPLFGRAPSRR